MSIIRIKSSDLEVKINTYGAELISIKSKSGKEFLWQGSAEWEAQAPVLFPIVGPLKDDTYTFNGKKYNLKPHGFARCCEFDVESQTESQATLLLKSSSKTRAVYPFDFEFRIVFNLDGFKFSQSYITLNKSAYNMYYSTGSHESYACPGGVENYSVIFDEEQTTQRLARFYDENGELYNDFVPCLENANTLKLSREFFHDDQLAILNLNSQGVSLRDDRTGDAIHISLSGFDTLIGWTKKGGNCEFICIEPWCGIWEHTKLLPYGDFSKKPGIRTLKPNEQETITHTITFHQ